MLHVEAGSPACRLLLRPTSRHLACCIRAGGDMMDVLVAEAKVVKHRVPEKPWQVW